MLTAIKEIYLQQAQPAEDTHTKVNMLMDYTHTYPNAIIRYKASDMQFYVDSDAANRGLPKARSKGTSYFYLSNKLTSMDKVPQPKTNGLILK